MSTVTTVNVEDCPYQAKALRKDIYVEFLAISGDYVLSAQVKWFRHCISVWDLRTDKRVAKFSGHKDTITGLAVSGNFVVSGSRDKTVKIWEITSNKCTRTFTGHVSEVVGVGFFKGKIASWDKDSTIIIRDFVTGKCLSTSNEIIATGAAHITRSYENKLITPKGNHAEIWDLETLSLIKTIDCGVKIRTQPMVVSEKFYAIPCEYMQYKIWSWNNDTPVLTVSTTAYCGAIFDHFFLTGDGVTKFKVCDIANGSMVRDFFDADENRSLGATSSISHIAMHGNMIVANSNEGVTLFKLGVRSKEPSAALAFVQSVLVEPLVTAFERLDKVLPEVKNFNDNAGSII